MNFVNNNPKTEMLNVKYLFPNTKIFTNRKFHHPSNTISIEKQISSKIHRKSKKNSLYVEKILKTSKISKKNFLDQAIITFKHQKRLSPNHQTSSNQLHHPHPYTSHSTHHSTPRSPIQHTNRTQQSNFQNFPRAIARGTKTPITDHLPPDILPLRSTSSVRRWRSLLTKIGGVDVSQGWTEWDACLFSVRFH